MTAPDPHLREFLDRLAAATNDRGPHGGTLVYLSNAARQALCDWFGVPAVTQLPSPSEQWQPGLRARREIS